MLDDNFYWNVYINLESMHRLDADFYRKYYRYKRACLLGNKSGDTNYRTSPQFINILKELNLSYEKIVNCSEIELKENGEYDYPAVAYKRREINKNGKKIVSLYACVANTNTNKKIPIGKIFDFMPLYTSGEVSESKSPKGGIPSTKIESTVGDLLNAFKLYLPVMGDFCYVETCSKLITSLCDFPINSITEVNFNSLIDKEEISLYINEFLENINFKKEAI